MHPRNKLRLLAGLTIDPMLERVERPAEAQELTEGHVGKTGSTIQDKSGKKWIVKGHDEGKGADEKYTLECPTTGKKTEKKASDLVKEMDTAGVGEVTPSPRASEFTSSVKDNYDDGDIVFYNNGIYLVVLSDPKTDMIGIIPAGLINASAQEKNRSVEMVKPDAEKCRKPTREEIEVFKMSDDELKAVDDDMSVEFSAEGWDLKAAGKAGKKYAKKKGGPVGPWGDKKKLNLKKKRASEEDCEMTEDAAGGAMGAAGATVAHDVAGGHGTTEAKSSSMGKRKKKKVKETAAPTDWNPPSQGGTRKELLGRLSKSKSSTDATAARKAGATQKELQKAMKESTHNYAPGNKVSHKDVQSDPINVVGQGEKQWANSLDPKMVKNEYTLQRDNRGEESMTEENSKVKVPSNLKSALKTAIKEFKEDAARQGNTHTARENAQMMMDTAEAFQTILDHLEEATVMDVKHAQIFAQSLMGPMLHKLPDGVWDFLSNGGQKRSLKDYMIKVEG